jgi:Spy/CpxP family protein refolding chaperone
MTSTTTHSRTLTRPRLLAAATALLAALVLAPQAQAQGTAPDQPRGDRRGQRMDPAQMVERRVARLTERLNLNSGQATQIRQILTQEQEQMRALWPQGAQAGPGRDDARRPDAAGRDSLRTAMRAIREGTEQRIDGVLTAEQRTAYRELRESQRKERRGGHRGGHRGEQGDRALQGGADRQGTH